MIAIDKMKAIFERAPSLIDSDNNVCLPISGMPKGHQFTWEELYELVQSFEDK